MTTGERRIKAAAPVEPDILYIVHTASLMGASDLHLVAGRPPLIRSQGRIRPLDRCLPLDALQVNELIFDLMLDEQKARLAERREIDFSYDFPGLCRLRINAFFRLGSLGAAIRFVPRHIPTSDDILLPDCMQKMIEYANGLVLVTGPTGSGKSTTLACLTDLINKSHEKHIVTIEDPIEFIYEPALSLVNQRELGEHTNSFANALKAALRQDPDVIVVSELRDLDSIALALAAAETGHLVLGTLHTSDAVSTVNRIIDVFPPHQQQQIRTQLASSLRAVVCQILLPRAEGRGLVAAREIMIVTPAIANLIRTDKNHEIPNCILTGAEMGMVRMDQDLARLARYGLISAETARQRAIDLSVFD